jgi:hypothetical protein
VSKKEQVSLEQHDQNESSPGEILYAASEHLISEDAASRTATGPLHSFDPSLSTGVASSEVDVASSEVSSKIPPSVTCNHP